MNYEFNFENEKKNLMVRIADQSRKIRQWISLRKRGSNNPLKMEIASLYSYQIRWSEFDDK